MVLAPIDAIDGIKKRRKSRVALARTLVDQDLKQRVSDYLLSRQMFALRNLDVQTDRGVVTLTGQVATFYEKQIALNVCRRVAGVYQLVDHVEVVCS